MSKRTLLLFGVLATACVFAVVGCNNSSSVITPTPNVDEQPVAAPEAVTVNYGATSATLSWSASSSALVTGYNVYKYSPSPDVESAYIKVNTDPVTGTYFSYSGLTDGGYYRVRSVTATGHESASSSFYHVNPLNPSGPPSTDPPPRQGEL